MPEERALGAAVIAVIIGIIGFFFLISGIFGLAQSVFNANWGGLNTNTFLSWLTTNQTVLSSVVILLGLIYLGIAVGLYRQHYWALIVMFVFGILYLVGEGSGVVYSLFLANPKVPITNTDVLGSIIGIVIVVIVLAYLAAVRDDFI